MYKTIEKHCQSEFFKLNVYTTVFYHSLQEINANISFMSKVEV